MPLHILNRRGTHAGQLERWLGRTAVEQLSLSMKDWYGPPIALAGVPGSVYAMRGGDFRGPILSGKFSNPFDIAEARIKRAWRDREQILQRWAYRQQSQCNTGFASLADLISEAQKGRRNDYLFNKSLANNAPGGNEWQSLWRMLGVPGVGAAAAAAPGGEAPVATTLGALGLINPASGNTQHYVSANVTPIGFPGPKPTLLLYDRIFAVAKTMNSTATEAVTGVPTRYQNTVPGANDYAGGNFLSVEIHTTCSNTAHNWTVCTYTDQSGAASTLPSLTGRALNVNFPLLDFANEQWFAPLESGDVGIQTLTQMQCSALVTTGTMNFIVGHPIAFLPCALAQMICQQDGIFTAFNLAPILDDACLSLLVLPNTTQSQTYSGIITTVAG